MEDRRPTTLQIMVNGALVGEIACNLNRPDLEPHSIPAGAGFLFHFPRPLALDEEVSVCFRNGKHLEGSPSRQHLLHLSQMLHGITGKSGLEFGALDRPLMSRDRTDVSFVDHADAAGLTAKYKHSDNISFVDASRIVKVDYVWAAGSLDAVVGGRRFDWAVASGVVEHVGDPIGWLAEIASVLRPGGRINLGVPDKTMTFDHARRLTTPAELLEDHYRRLQRPSFRHIVDHMAGASTHGSAPPDRATQVQRYKSAHAVARHAEETNLYVDVHCHVWTPESWRECWDAVTALNLLPLRQEKVLPTLRETGQFLVSLVKV